MTAAFERLEPGAELRIARLSFEFLRPIPLAPLTLRTARPCDPVGGGGGTAGRGISRSCGAALRVQAVPQGGCRAALAGASAGASMPPPPSSGKPVRFALNDSSDASFAATAMEMRWLDDPRALGPGRVWMRLRHPLLPGQSLTPLARLAATADFGNGVSAALPFDRFLFINADLTIHLQRQPRRVDRPRRAHAAARRRRSGLAKACCTTSTVRSAAPFRRSWSRSAERRRVVASQVMASAAPIDPSAHRLGAPGRRRSAAQRGVLRARARAAADLAR